jgi:hypothetical protein
MCAVWTTLFYRYSDAIDGWVLEVNRLIKLAGSGVHDGYVAQLERCATVRRSVAAVREAMDEHVRQHGCVNPIRTSLRANPEPHEGRRISPVQ